MLPWRTHPATTWMVILGLIMRGGECAPKIGRVSQHNLEQTGGPPASQYDIFDPSKPDAQPRPRSNSGWGRQQRPTAPGQLQTLKMDADGNMYDDSGFNVQVDAGGWPLDGFQKTGKAGTRGHRPEQGAAAAKGHASPAGARIDPEATPTDESCRRIGSEAACEREMCYWSAGSQKCYVKYVPGSQGTYAQNYQDWWVKKVAEHNKWGEDGYFLDLGAHSGIWCSNTKLLEEKLGWSGVCVEPFPENGPTRGSFTNRTCTLVARALTGSIDRQAVRMDGADAQSMKLNLADVRRDSDGREGGKEATTASVATLFRDHVPTDRNFINFVSLDVEGLELNVLEYWPWSTKVGVWIIEHNNEDEKRASIVELLMKHGYKRRNVENSGVDDFFVADEFWSNQLEAKPWRVHPHGTFGC